MPILPKTRLTFWYRNIFQMSSAGHQTVLPLAIGSADAVALGAAFPALASIGRGEFKTRAAIALGFEAKGGARVLLPWPRRGEPLS